MPSVIRLTIDLDARLQGIDRTIEGLKKTEAAGKSLNQNLKTSNIDQMKLALERAYHTDALFNGEVKASSKYVNNLSKAMKNLETAKGKGELFSFTGANGVTTQTDNLKQAYAQFSDLSAMVEGNASVAKSVTKTSPFDLTGYYSDMEKDAKVTSLFHGNLDVVNQKMASLQAQIEKQTKVNLDLGDLTTMDTKLTALKVKKDALQKSYTAATDPTSYGGDATEQINAQTRYNEEIEKTNSQITQLENKKQVFKDNASSIDNMSNKWATLNEEQTKMLNHYDGEEFFGDLDKQTEGVRMFGTELDVVQNRMSAVKSQGMKLVNTGGDQKEIKKLATEYRKLETQSKALSKATNGTGTRIKNLVKNFVSAQLVVWLIRSAFSALTKTIKESSAAQAEAQQNANKFATVFKDLESANQTVLELQNDYGLAQSTAQNATATMGDMAIGLGATVQQAAEFADVNSKFLQDLRAFKDIGGDVQAMTQAYMSGAAGNTRNFRQWGSIVKENTVLARLHESGMDKLTGTALEWAKAQMRVNIVMEQQQNAMGATQREWGQLITVNNRYNEQTKMLKENLGASINKYFLPLKKQILDLVSGWNKAYDAKQNYLNDTPASAPIYDTSTEEGEKKAKKAITGMLSKMEGTWTFLGVTHNVTAKQYEEVARAIGLTADETASLVSINYDNNKALKAELQAYDLLISKNATISKIFDESRENLSAYSDFVQDVLDDISDMYKNMGSVKFLEQDPREFVSAEDITYQHIVGADTTTTDQQAKMEALMALYKEFNNFVITGGDTSALEESLASVTQQINDINSDIQTYGGSSRAGLLSGLESQKKLLSDALANPESTEAAEKALDDVTSAIVDLNKEIQKEPFLAFEENTQAQIARLKEQNALTKEYGDDNSDIVTILMAQYDAEQSAYDLKKAAIEAGVSLYDAEQGRLKLMGSINTYYELQVDAANELKETTRELAEQERKREILAEDRSKLSEASETISSVAIENEAKRMNLKLFWNPSSQETASSDYKASITAVDQTVKEMMAGFLTEHEQELVALGIYSNEMLLSADEVKKVSKYKTELETSAELECQQSLKDARDTSLQNIESMWESLGDVGMIQGWMDTYSNTKAYETNQGTSEEDASKIATATTWEEIILEFASYIDAVGDIFGIITTMFEELGPIVSDFLQPLMPILEIIVDLFNVFVPILTLIMPILQVLAVTLIQALEPFQALIKAIQWALGKITWWTKNDDISWDEVMNTHNDNVAKIEDIWALEIGARASYVSELTDAQEGEIAAYKEMYESGLLDLSEYLSLRNDVTGGTDTSSIAAFANGGNFVTNGPQMILVGDNPGGKEHVVVEPLSSSNAYSSLGNSRTYSKGGNVYSPIFNITSDNPMAVARSVEDILVKMERRGESYAS